MTPGGDRVNSGAPPTPDAASWKLTVPLASVTVPVNDGENVTDGTGLHDWVADADTSMLHVLSDCSVPCTESWPSPSTVMSAATDNPLVPSENETVESWNGTPANGVNGPAIGPLRAPGRAGLAARDCGGDHPGCAPVDRPDQADRLAEDGQPGDRRRAAEGPARPHR